MQKSGKSIGQTPKCRTWFGLEPGAGKKSTKEHRISAKVETGTRLAIAVSWPKLARIKIIVKTAPSIEAISNSTKEGRREIWVHLYKKTARPLQENPTCWHFAWAKNLLESGLAKPLWNCLTFSQNNQGAGHCKRTDLLAFGWTKSCLNLPWPKHHKTNKFLDRKQPRNCTILCQELAQLEGCKKYEIFTAFLLDLDRFCKICYEIFNIANLWR